jgi:uncharacterized protein with FMN-binding domain
MRKTLTVLACSAAFTVPVGNLWAATHARAAQKKKVVTVAKSVVSPVVDVSRWGQLEVQVKLTLTTTTVGGKATKSFKITSLSFPVYPQHTDRSAFISQKALPLLREEVLQIKGNSIQPISGATDTSYAFVQALRGALAKAGA